MKKKPYAILICLMLLFFLLGTGPLASAGKKIRVAFFYWPGFNTILEDGSLSGYGYDYLREIKKYVDWEYEFVTEIPATDAEGKLTGNLKRLSYADGLAMLQSGQVDLIGSVRKTAEREKLYAYPDLPAGKANGILAVRADREDYQLSEPASFDNMRIGVLGGSSRNNELEQYILRLGAQNVKLLEFRDLEKADAALHREKSIDGIFSSLRYNDNERAILRIAPDDHYFITRQDAPEILADLNAAQTQMQNNTPYFQENLNEKYYALSKSRQVILTETEKAYVKAHPVLKVGIVGNNPPLVYGDAGGNGKAQGIVVDVMKKIAESIGVQVEFVNLNGAGPIDRDMLKQNQIEVLGLAFSDYKWADERGLDLTTAYLSMPVSAIVNSDIKDISSKECSVALVTDNDFIEKMVRSKYPYDTFKKYPTVRAAVDSVEMGNSSLTFMPLYQAEMFARDPRLRNIKAYSNTGSICKFSVGVSKDSDPILFHLLNKAVDNIPATLINQIVAENSMLHMEEEPLINEVYRHPFAFMGLLAILAALGYVGWRKRKTVESALEFSEMRFRIAAQQGQLAVWDYDIEKKQITQSLEGHELKGLGKVIDNMPWKFIEAGFLHPSSEPSYYAMYQRLFDGEKTTGGVFRFKCRDENNEIIPGYNWFKITYTIVQGRGKRIWAIGVSEDVTAEKDAEMEVLNSKKYQAVTLARVLARYEVDVSEGKLLSSDLKEMDSTALWDEKLKAHIKKMVYPEHQARLYEVLCQESLQRNYEDGNFELQSEVLIKTPKAGEYYWVTCNVYLINESKTEHIYATIYFKNTDQQKRRELFLKKNAERDPLTGVYNRKVMQNLVGDTLHYKGMKTNGHLMVLDIDDFKQVNDRFGHSTGDAVLIEFSRCLMQFAARQTDIVGRLGGDEFLVFLGGSTTLAGATLVAKKILQALAQQNGIRPDLPPIYCSIGIASAPEHASDFMELYRKADVALYQAKAEGKRRYCVYREELDK